MKKDTALFEIVCRVCQTVKGVESFIGKTKKNGRFYYDKICKECLNKRLRSKRVIKRQNIPEIPGEIWVHLPEFEGHYQISNLARVKSIDRVVMRSDGFAVRKPSQIRKVRINQDGYLQLVLIKDGNFYNTSLHIQMAKAFVPNPNNLPEVNHIDGNKQNCLPTNLEWNTHLCNMQHAVKNGLRKYAKGGPSIRYKIPLNDVLYIYRSDEKTGVLAKKYNVTKSAIQRIKNGQTYSKVTNHGAKE